MDFASSTRAAENRTRWNWIVANPSVVPQKIGGLPPPLVWVPLLIVNNYSEFQVNIFSNNRDIRKCQSFRTNAAADATDDTRAMTILRYFLRKQPS